MLTSPWMICKTFIESSSATEQQSLLSLLPKNIQERFALFPSIEVNAQRKSLSKQQLLSKIHFSWFAPILRHFSENDIRIFLAALSTDQITGLQNRLRLSNHLPKLSPNGREFIWDFLTRHLMEDTKDLLPFHFLPRTSLSPLLDIPSSLFSILFSFLGLYDLAFALKQIIDTQLLKKVYASLSEPQKQFLSSIQVTKLYIPTKHRFLEGWDGEDASMQSQLEQRGLQHFALALSGQDTHFMWYLMHFMDMGYAQKIKSSLVPLESSKTLEILQQNVLQVLASIKTMDTL